MIFSFIVSTFMGFVIYGSLSEEDIRDILAKRSVSGGLSNIAGFALGTFLLATLPAQRKFGVIYPLGAVVGLLSTASVLMLDLSHLEGAPLPKAVREPERVFSTSLFFVVLLLSGNLLSMIWTPYLMNELGGSDSLAASINLIGTISSILASLVWRRSSFKTLRVGHGLNALSPLLVWMTPLPILHVPISAYVSFTYTAANFLGSFLFAEYTAWFGAVRSGILLAVIGNVAQLLAATIGMVARESYLVAFPATLGAGAASVLLALLTIPEVSIVPEDVARSYSHTLYRSSILGYRVAVEVSRETILTTFRIMALTIVFATLYLIYRALIILVS